MSFSRKNKISGVTCEFFISAHADSSKVETFFLDKMRCHVCQLLPRIRYKTCISVKEKEFKMSKWHCLTKASQGGPIKPFSWTLPGTYEV